MGLSKTHIFNDYQNQIAKVSKAFSHPARVAILEYLMTNKTCVVGSLTNELGLSQSTISQHLRELKNIGIVKGEIEGPSICYCIDKDEWDRLSGSLKAFLIRVSSNCC